MALTTPVAQTKIAFDATTASIFTFTSSGGSQVVANRITIRRNSDNFLIYQNKVTSFLLQQEVPADTLINGVQYNFYFNTYDSDDNISGSSNIVAFWCYTAPTLVITNMPVTNIIETASYEFESTYDQIEGELIEYIQYFLYDINDNLLDSSDKIFNTNTPPIATSYIVTGLENNTSYKIQVEGISINGTQTLSPLYVFSAQYYYPNLFSLITLVNECDEGYTQIQSNVVLAEGIPDPAPAMFESHILDGNEASYIMWNEWYTNPDDILSVWTERYGLSLKGENPLYYSTESSGLGFVWNEWYTNPDNILGYWAENTSILYQDISRTLTYSDGFNIPSNFQYQVWMSGAMNGDIVDMYKASNPTNKLTISIRSGIPSGETEIKSWIEATTTNGNLFEYSAYVDRLRVDTTFIAWFKKVDDTYYLLLDILDAGTGLYIEGGTDIYPTTAIRNDISDIFPIDTVVLKNGLYYNLDITSNTDRAYSQTFPDWDYYTRLNSDFYTTSGGNIDLILSQLESVRIKRRIDGDFNWITLYEFPVVDENSLQITTQDRYGASYETYDYAIVPVLNGGIEGQYIIASIDSQFSFCYLCDEEQIFVFIGDTIHGGISGNTNSGMLTPIGRQYPIPIDNSENNYETGSFTGDILGSSFLTNRTKNNKEIIQQVNQCKAFLNNKKSKIFKDYQGRIKVVSTTASGGYQESANLQTGLATITFNWVETGNYNNQTDLYDNGLVSTLG